MNKKFWVKKFTGLSSIFINILSLLPLGLRKTIFNTGRNLPTIFGLYWRYISFKSISFESGENIYIAQNIYMKNIENIILGSNVSIHEMCYLDGYGGIKIGDNVSIAHSTSLISFDHTYDDTIIPIKYNLSIKKIIIVHNDIWIGAGVRILGGNTIHKRSIIAAGSVITKDVESYSIYGGIPAKKIKNIEGK